MSVLDRGNAELLVYPMVKATDPDGNEVWQPAADPVTVRASLQPVTSADVLVSGQEVDTVYRVRPVRGTDVPLGAWDRIEWDGRSWDVIGDPTRRDASPRTRRTVFHIRTRTARGT